MLGFMLGLNKYVFFSGFDSVTFKMDSRMVRKDVMGRIKTKASITAQQETSRIVVLHFL